MVKRSRWKEEIGNIIRELREEPLFTKDITEKVAKEGYNTSAGRRINRHLELLQTWGLVKKKKNKWYWFEHVQPFSSKHTYELALNHSLKLLEDEVSTSGRFDVESTRFIPAPPGKRYVIGANLLLHLKTGHPELYSLYEKHRETNKQLNKTIETLIDKTLEASRRISGTGYSIPPEKLEAVCLVAMREISMAKKRGYPTFVADIPEVAEKYGESRDEIDKLLEKVKELWGKEAEEFGSLEERDVELSGDLRAGIEKLKHQAEHGTPLMGGCELCPGRVYIEDSSSPASTGPSADSDSHLG